jgi:VanZ family protein
MRARDADLSASRPSSLPRILWFVFTLFIVYGGTIPFHFSPDARTVRDKLSRLPLNPLIAADTGRRVSIPDVVQNVALFVPFGAFGVLTLGRRRTNAAAIVAVAACALAVSIGVETLQLFESDRTTSVSDVCANLAGSLIGAAATVAASGFAAAAMRRLRALGVVDVPAFYPFVIATLVLSVAAWEPFDFTLDVGTLVGRLRAIRVDPWQFAMVSDEGVEFIRYALFGLAAATWLRQIGRRGAAAAAAVAGAALAFLLEGTQFIVGSRMPGLEDAIVHAGGAAAGAAFSAGWPYGRSGTFWFRTLLIATAGAAAVQMLSPFDIAPTHRPLTWLPLSNYYEHTSFETLSHAFELALIYFPLGFAASASSSTGVAWLRAAAATLLIAVPLEWLQGWVTGRYGDVTDVGISLLGAAFGAWAGRAGWRRFGDLQPKHM